MRVRRYTGLVFKGSLPWHVRRGVGCVVGLIVLACGRVGPRSRPPCGTWSRASRRCRRTRRSCCASTATCTKVARRRLPAVPRRRGRPPTVRSGRRRPAQGEGRHARRRRAAHADRLAARRTGARCRKCATRSSTSASRASRSSPTSNTAATASTTSPAPPTRCSCMPTAPLDLTGVASYELFLRGTLDKIGAYPDFAAHRRLQDRGEPVHREDLHAAHREMAESLNRDLYEQLVRGIAEGRQEDRGRGARADRSTGRSCRRTRSRAGLVDDLAYEDQLDDGELKLTAATTKRIEADDYAEDHARVASGSTAASRSRVIYAVRHHRLGQERLRSAQRRRRRLRHARRVHPREARDDDSIKAIVLRIDSPGGSAIASDVDLARADDHARREARRARSSRRCRTSRRRAATTSRCRRTRSSRSRHADRIDRHLRRQDRDRRHAETSSARNIEAVQSRPQRRASTRRARRSRRRERAKVQEQHAGVLRRVRREGGRRRGNTTPEKIDAVAQGRVWTGQQAQASIGLVDELGGLDAAIAVAKQRAKIPADERRGARRLSAATKSSTRLLSSSSRRRGSAGRCWARPAAGATSAARCAADARPSRLFRRGEPLALMPYVFREVTRLRRTLGASRPSCLRQTLVLRAFSTASLSGRT